ncbi:MAG: S41 family peptidase [Terrimicrobiaceae bacterium]|nr:S41 family peptidase [Terrimicrobiaceae bacterium]
MKHAAVALLGGAILGFATWHALAQDEQPGNELLNHDEPAADQTKKSDEDSPYENMHVLARAMQLIRQDYVDDHKISFRDLTYSALRGMLSELDPHSSFMDPRDFKGMQEDTKSEFGGLGVTVTTKDGLLTLIGVAEGTPGFEAGLQPGDQIRKINGASTDRMTMADAVDMLRGEAGEKVTLTISRPVTNELKEFTIARAVIKVPSVVDAMILPTDHTGGHKLGYLRLTQFNEPTAGELAAALDSLEKQGMEALILDLRFNPGGLLSSAVDVCSQFLPPNTRVVSTEGRSPAREYFTRSTKTGLRTYPVAILINGSSASGSEIVAGALKDLHRAILVGETTFGKGSVQSVVSLPDGSAMRFTTAKYYTPSRRPIHEHGVAPDIRCAMTLEEEARLYQARRRKEMPGVAQDRARVQDPQLDRAIDALTGVLLYTGRTGGPAKG